MHQIVCPLGLCSRPHWGSLQRSPDSLAVFRGPTSKGREGEWRGGKKRGKGEERGGREREGERREGVRPT